MSLNPKKLNNVSLIITAGFPSQFPAGDRPEIAFAGRSNVGKSSLLNALVRRKNLARTSNTPGKTRLVNFYDIDGQIRFVDLPGYGYAEVSKAEKARWSRLIDGYLRNRECLSGIVHLLDIRHDPTEEDHQMLEWIASTGLPVVWALTKADKLSGNQRVVRVRNLMEILNLNTRESVIPFSSTKGVGIDDLWSRILAMVESP